MPTNKHKFHFSSASVAFDALLVGGGAYPDQGGEEGKEEGGERGVTECGAGGGGGEGG